MGVVDVEAEVEGVVTGVELEDGVVVGVVDVDVVVVVGVVVAAPALTMLTFWFAVCAHSHSS